MDVGTHDVFAVVVYDDAAVHLGELGEPLGGEGCVIEEEALILDVAGQLCEITRGLGVPFIFKASFDKANRSSHESFRGPGVEAGLRILSEVKRQIGVPVLTDVHEDTNMQEVADVVAERLAQALGVAGPQLSVMCLWVSWIGLGF